MFQFKSFLIQFAVYLIVIAKVVKSDSIQLSNEFHINGTEIHNLNSSNFLFVDDNSSDEATSIYADDDDEDSDFTIIYDKEYGYKKIPLSEMAQSDEIIPAFDAARDVRFELYTPKNLNQPQLLTLDNYTTVEQSYFNWRYNTRILIHGW